MERSLGNMVNGLARAQSAAEGIVGVLDNLENTFRTPIWVGGAAAIGLALNQALEGAARGASRFSDSVEEMLSKSTFDATIESVQGMREQMKGLEAQARDASLFEKWIFGGQKEQQLQEVQRAIEQAAGFARNARIQDMNEALTDSLAGLGIAGANASGREEDADLIQQRFRQTQELRKAEEDLQRVISKGGTEEIIIQRDIFAAVVQRHEFERQSTGGPAFKG